MKLKLTEEQAKYLLNDLTEKLDKLEKSDKEWSKKMNWNNAWMSYHYIAIQNIIIKLNDKMKKYYKNLLGVSPMIDLEK